MKTEYFSTRKKMRDFSTPLLSVIIATYNRSNVLPYSIGSALRQTFTDFEVLVVGDGCTDDSQTVVEKIGDARVRWVNLPENSGHQSQPNNEGLRQARGRYIAYLGHDDLWLPHHLSCLVAALEADADLACGLTLSVDAHGNDRNFAPDRAEYSTGMWIPPTGVAHRKSVTERIGGWRYFRELIAHPEEELWQRACDAGYKFEFVPRLTAIKFSASARRDVYKIRPRHEQAAWFERIQNEDDFEARELASTLFVMARRAGVLASQTMESKPYRALLRDFVCETRLRLARRIGRAQPDENSAKNKGASIDAAREFKGLEHKP